MFRRRRSTEDFAEEIKAHLELEADELKGEGLTDGEAHRKSRVEFGSVQKSRERFYLRSRVAWLDGLGRDIRFAMRQLSRNPGFTATAILVLALGREIIGEVEDVREGALESEPWPVQCSSIYQDSDNFVTVVVRTSDSEAAILPTLVSTMHQLDPISASLVRKR